MKPLRASLWIALSLAGLLLPSAAEASWLGFRNDSRLVLTVQTYAESRQGNRLGVPHLIHPGETSWEWVEPQCSRRLNVRSGAAPRTLLVQGVELSVKSSDALFAIQPSPQPAKETKLEVRKVWEGSRQPPR